MRKHRIKIIKGDFSSQRIEKHKNYSHLMQQYQRRGRMKVNQYLLGLIVLGCVVGISYYALDRIEEFESNSLEPMENEQLIKDFPSLQDGYRPEETPRPAAGIGAYYQYLEENLAMTREVEGIVYVTFTVEADGSINDLRVLKGLCAECDQLALNLVEKGPSWTPAMRNGKAVAAPMVLPITFRGNKHLEDQ